ncbi:MAG: hypothetical protein DBY16_08095 [Coprobacter sp.]|nr:MAG: hypothetical protein DBY16_08095 [Coprobacter sp.]
MYNISAYPLIAFFYIITKMTKQTTHYQIIKQNKQQINKKTAQKICKIKNLMYLCTHKHRGMEQW